MCIFLILGKIFTKYPNLPLIENIFRNVHVFQTLVMSAVAAIIESPDPLRAGSEQALSLPRL